MTIRAKNLKIAAEEEAEKKRKEKRKSDEENKAERNVDAVFPKIRIRLKVK